MGTFGHQRVAMGWKIGNVNKIGLDLFFSCIFSYLYVLVSVGGIIQLISLDLGRGKVLFTRLRFVKPFSNIICEVGIAIFPQSDRLLKLQAITYFYSFLHFLPIAIGCFENFYT